VVREFATSWKIGIEQVNRNVLSYFSNFRNGMEILKQVLTQLFLYYTRFQDIIRMIWRNKHPAFCKDLVSTSVILVEIKKYALSI
jgi:vacuolar protein sorting-associated protein 52